MTPGDTARLLAKAAAFDQRTIGETDVLAWHEVLGDVDTADAMVAVSRWYAEHRERVMPSDVRRIAREIDRDRRRVSREQREAAEAHAIEADPTRRDRSAEVAALIAQLRDRLPPTDPAVVRRPEWLRSDRQRQRWPVAPPNPHYDPAALSRLATMLAELEDGAA